MQNVRTTAPKRNTKPVDKKGMTEQRLSLKSLQGVARPTSSKSENVTIRLSGTWLEIWHQLRDELSPMTDSDILRQAIALRAALLAVDTKGNRPISTIEYVDDTGKKRRAGLEEYVGIASRS